MEVQRYLFGINKLKAYGKADWDFIYNYISHQLTI